MFNPDQPRDEIGRWTETTPLFHGSDSRFDEFDDSKIGTRDPGYLGRGFYFSTDPNIGRSNKHTMEVRASPQRPLGLSVPDFRTDKRSVIRDALGLPRNASADDVTEALRARGYDSVVLDYSPAGYRHKEVMVMSAKRVSYVRHLNDHTITRASFDKLSPIEKRAIVRTKSKIVD